jgi:hypothetical protein
MKRIAILVALIMFLSPSVWAASSAMVVGASGYVAAAGGAPTLVSATLDGWGTTMTLVFSESVTVGAGGNAGWTIDMNDTTGETLTYASGSGSDTLVYTVNRNIHAAATGTVAYTQPGNGIEATTGGADVATIGTASVTNGSTMLVAQNFEGTGYDNGESWSENLGGSGGVVNEDYTSTALRGSQSLYISQGADGYAVTLKSFTAGSPRYVFARVRFPGFGDGTASAVFGIDADGTGTTWDVAIDATNGGGIRLYNGATNTSCGTLSANTTYYIWLDYTKGTGSNGSSVAYIGTTGSKPAATCTISNGASTTNAGYVGAITSYARTPIYDQIYVSTAPIGDVPN